MVVITSIWSSWKCLIWFPITKSWGWYVNQVSSMTRTQIYNFTPWGRPGPPTAPLPCSWPSDQAEDLEKGPKWFPIPQNIYAHNFKKKFTSSSSAAATKKAAMKYLTYAKAGMSKNERYKIWLVKTSRIKKGINLRPKRLAFSLGRRLRNLILITKIDIKCII